MLVGGPEAAERSKFASTFDHFLDSLNVRNFTSGFDNLKPFHNHIGAPMTSDWMYVLT